MIFEIFKDRSKQFRFRIKSRNGKTIAQSEGYRSKRGVKNIADSLNTVILDGRTLKIKDKS